MLFLSRTLLFSHCESTEEGTRNVVAECLGKLTLVDPLRLLPQLKVCDNMEYSRLSHVLATWGVDGDVSTAHCKFPIFLLPFFLFPSFYFRSFFLPSFVFPSFFSHLSFSHLSFPILLYYSSQDKRRKNCYLFFLRAVGLSELWIGLCKKYCCDCCQVHYFRPGKNGTCRLAVFKRTQIKQ